MERNNDEPLWISFSVEELNLLRYLTIFVEDGDEPIAREIVKKIDKTLEATPQTILVVAWKRDDLEDLMNEVFWKNS